MRIDRQSPHDAGTALDEGLPGDEAACVALWLAALTARDRHDPAEGTAARCRSKFAAPHVAWLIARGPEAEVRGFGLVTAAGSGRATDPEGAAYLSLLAVAPEAQGRGVGGTLLDALHERVATSGFDRAVLHVLQSNAGAIALYRDRGWQPHGDPHPHALDGALSQTYSVELRTSR